MTDDEFWYDIGFSETMMGLSYASKEEIDWCTKIKGKTDAFRVSQVR